MWDAGSCCFWAILSPLILLIQGFQYFVWSWGHEFQVNPWNPLKFIKTHRIPQNSLEIVLNTGWTYLKLILAAGAVYLPWSCKFIVKICHCCHCNSLWPRCKKPCKLTKLPSFLVKNVCPTNAKPKCAQKISTKYAVCHWPFSSKICPENFCYFLPVQLLFPTDLSLEILQNLPSFHNPPEALH